MCIFGRCGMSLARPLMPIKRILIDWLIDCPILAEDVSDDGSPINSACASGSQASQSVVKWTGTGRYGVLAGAIIVPAGQAREPAGVPREPAGQIECQYGQYLHHAWYRIKLFQTQLKFCLLMLLDIINTCNLTVGQFRCNSGSESNVESRPILTNSLWCWRLYHMWLDLTQKQNISLFSFKHRIW
jgi:hypothetical protein